MKAHLLFPDRDLDTVEARLDTGDDASWSLAQDVVQDLELESLFAAMADGDRLIHEVAGRIILAPLTDPSVIRYRQAVLADCLAHAAGIRELYALSGEALERERHIYGGLLGRRPEGLLHRSIQVIEMFVEVLVRLRSVAETHEAEAASTGLRTLFAMLRVELGEDYLASVREHLARLRFDQGVPMSARLGAGNRGADYLLHPPAVPRPFWRAWLFGDERGGLVFDVAPRDEAGLRALAELRDRGVGLVAVALAQSTDHILGFFRMLRTELAFYVGCLNLRERLGALAEPVCFPEPLPMMSAARSASELYDPCLALVSGARVVGNDVAADGKRLVLVTGANRGGKSTFLRSVGLAQLMMQSGMFVAASAFQASVHDRLYTHFKREEDAQLRSGKLDEELARMRAIVDEVTPGSLVLLNESFASTNEREGSEIARQIVRALLDSGITVGYVTHLHDLAAGFEVQARPDLLFLRAERTADGRRTFRVVEGAPLATSHGGDLFRRVFGAALTAADAAPPGSGA
jgi:hypothetical protein